MNKVTAGRAVRYQLQCLRLMGVLHTDVIQLM